MRGHMNTGRLPHLPAMHRPLGSLRPPPRWQVVPTFVLRIHTRIRPCICPNERQACCDKLRQQSRLGLSCAWVSTAPCVAPMQHRFPAALFFVGASSRPQASRSASLLVCITERPVAGRPGARSRFARVLQLLPTVCTIWKCAAWRLGGRLFVYQVCPWSNDYIKRRHCVLRKRAQAQPGVFLCRESSGSATATLRGNLGGPVHIPGP